MKPRELLENICSKIEGLHYVNPVHLKASQSKFFENHQDPIFEYEAPASEYQEYLSQLTNLEFGPEPGDELYELARQATLNSIKLVQAVGTESFTTRSLEGNPSPTIEELKLANQRLNEQKTPAPKGQAISSTAMLQALCIELEDLGLTGWSAEFRGGVSRCYVASNQRKIYLRPDAKYYEQDRLKLVAHEIWGHVLRSANGYEQPLPILGTSLPEANVTEEGITHYLEQVWGVASVDGSSSRHVLAIDTAQKGSFTEVFEVIRPYYQTDEAAFNGAVRAKRGLRDTAQPGGYTKDVLYLRGELAVEGYMKSDGSLEELYVGKIGLENLLIIKKLQEQNLVLPAKWLPKLPKV